MTNKFKFGDKVTYRSCKKAFYLVKTDEKNSLIAVEKNGVIKGAVVTAFTDELTPATDWVKCSERMPELGVPVLVIGGSTAWVDKAYDSDDGISFYEDNYGRATHWMPLPDRPTEVE